MSDLDQFVEWFRTTWTQAEHALHSGDAGPRTAIWSEHDPVTLFGAWLSASGAAEVRAVFPRLAAGFAAVTSSRIDLIAVEVSGDLAYTAHREITSVSVDGIPRQYVLRVTQVYRREDGQWRVVHRHGDEESEPPASGS